jgi:hypothetical protein
MKNIFKLLHIFFVLLTAGCISSKYIEIQKEYTQFDVKCVSKFDLVMNDAKKGLYDEKKYVVEITDETIGKPQFLFYTGDICYKEKYKSYYERYNNILVVNSNKIKYADGIGVNAFGVVKKFSQEKTTGIGFAFSDNDRYFSRLSSKLRCTLLDRFSTESRNIRIFAVVKVQNSLCGTYKMNHNIAILPRIDFTSYISETYDLIFVELIELIYVEPNTLGILANIK